MSLFATFVPLLHGRIGPLDDSESFLAPIVVVITLLVWKLLNRRSTRPRDRVTQRNHENHDKRRIGAAGHHTLC